MSNTLQQKAKQHREVSGQFVPCSSKLDYKMYFEAALKYPLRKVSGSLCDTDGIKQSSQISDLREVWIWNTLLQILFKISAMLLSSGCDRS